MHSHSFQDTELKLHRYANDSPWQVMEGLTIYISSSSRLQNSLARAVMCTGKFDSITPVLGALHWLPISACITYKVALLTRKVLTTQQRGYQSSLIRVNQPTRQLRPSTHRVLCSTAPRTAFASRAFCHAAPAVWNELPNLLNFIHSTVSLSEFKRNLKSFLFKQSNNGPHLRFFFSLNDFILYWSWHYGALSAA